MSQLFSGQDSYMGVCDAFRDVLMIAGEPIDRIGLNND